MSYEDGEEYHWQRKDPQKFEAARVHPNTAEKPDLSTFWPTAGDASEGLGFMHDS
jgi:hypothetical protein